MTNEQVKELTIETEVTIIDPATGVSTQGLVKGIDEDTLGNVKVTVAYVTPIVATFNADEVSEIVAVVEPVATATAVVVDATPITTPEATQKVEAVEVIAATQENIVAIQDGTATEVANTPILDRAIASSDNSVGTTV